MARQKTMLTERLLAAKVAIENSISDQEVKALLVEFGYDDARLSLGKSLLDEVYRLQGIHRKEYGDQYGATKTLNKIWQQADKVYMRIVKVARVALKDNFDIYQTLELIGRRKETFHGWTDQAKSFYSNSLSNPLALEKMAIFGMTREKLEAGNVLLTRTEAANLVQEKEKGEAQEVTKVRDRAMEKLEEWLGDFLAIAEIALEDNPQLSERLGIVVPS